MANKNLIILNKKIGQTPLQLLDEFRQQEGLNEEVKMTYAGRLDPLACGKILVLKGEECKKKNEYLKLDKEYEFEILLNIKTDSGDTLGLPIFFKEKVVIDKKLISKKLSKFIGKQEMQYPVFSSKTVKGKPLFQWFKEGKMKDINVPRKKIEIYQISYLASRKISKQNLKKEVSNKLNSIVEGGKNNNFFRLDEIKKEWRKIFFNKFFGDDFYVLKFKATVSSGAYIRVLSEWIAKDIFGTNGLAMSIDRKKIGKVKKIFNFIFWWKEYK